MGTVERLGIVQWRQRVHGVGLYDEAQVLPVVEVGRAIGTYAPCPDIGAGGGAFLVLSIPVVDTVLDENLWRVGVNGLALRVEPEASGTDGFIGLGARLRPAYDETN